MRNCINIKANNISFKYLLEYTKSNGNVIIENNDSKPVEYYITSNDIKLFNYNINYYRDKNDWYNISHLSDQQITPNTEHIPKNISIVKLRLYIPTFAISIYIKKFKYALTLNTWINGKKIDLGTHIFSPSDALAIQDKCIKDGNNEYYEYVEFDIIDPFYLLYSSDWQPFRTNLCGEVQLTNDSNELVYNDSNEAVYTNDSIGVINASLFIIEEYQGNYILRKNITGGYTNFNISDDTDDYLSVDLKISQDQLGFDFNISMNTVYEGNLLEYLKETYYLTDIKDTDISFELVIKDKNSIIFDPKIITYFSIRKDINKDNKKCVHKLAWSEIGKDNLIKKFFDDWNTFTETYSFVGSVIVTKEQNEVISLVSNEIPITQEIFSIFTNGGSEKIIDINDMNINTFNVVNKIENNVTMVERPNESKSNIIQPVFFRVKDSEFLTLHPAVTENISINLDQYKSKVNKFTLKIGENYFNQIGANNYGILFKISANILPKVVSSGIYYILGDDNELITTGKYNCVV